MSYVPASSKSDLLALLAAAVATVVGIEWLWRRFHPRPAGDADTDTIAMDRAGDPFPNGDHPESPPAG